MFSSLSKCKAIWCRLWRCLHALLYQKPFQQAHTPEIRKVIATVNDWDGNMLPLAVVQHFFKGGIEVPIKLAGYRNNQRVDAEPYMRTSHPVLKKNPRKMHDRIMQESCRWMLWRGRRESLLYVSGRYSTIESRHTISICASVKVTLHNDMSSMFWSCWIREL